jgi:hypothetical protein
LQDVLDGNLLHSIFAFANGALFVYGIATFIGFARAWDDLHHGIDGVRAGCGLRPPPSGERVRMSLGTPAIARRGSVRFAVASDAPRAPRVPGAGIPGPDLPRDRNRRPRPGRP